LNEWHIYRNDVLGDIRDRYETDDPAMSKGDLEDALEGIEEARPDAVSAEIAHEATPMAVSATPSAFPTIPIGQ